MKSLYKSACLLILVLITSFVEDKSKKVIFFGDSITQAGVGPTGYITKMKQLLESKGLDKNFELIGAGISGNKVYDLYLRLEDDVLTKNPDIVYIFVGVNDVWHKSSFGTGTDLDKFEKFYLAIIKKLKAQQIEVIVCTPACIGERNDASNMQDGDLNQYSKKIREMAASTNSGLVDLRKIFLDYNLKNNPENKEKNILTTDRVHLNDLGNDTLANEMLLKLLK